MNARSRKVLLLSAGLAGLAAVIVVIEPPLQGDSWWKIQAADKAVTEFVAAARSARIGAAGSDLMYLGPLQEQWDAVRSAWEGLTYSNAKTATARVLLHLPERPQWVSEHTWQSRAEDAMKDWVVWGMWDWVKMLLLTSCGVFVGAWLLLTALVYAWYFALDRLREVSSAVRGEEWQ